MQSPIAKLKVYSTGQVVAELYAPGLPDGTHDLYIESGDARIAELERGLSEIEQITLNDRAAAEKQVAVRDIVRSLMVRESK